MDRHFSVCVRVDVPSLSSMRLAASGGDSRRMVTALKTICEETKGHHRHNHNTAIAITTITTTTTKYPLRSYILSSELDVAGFHLSKRQLVMRGVEVGLTGVVCERTREKRQRDNDADCFEHGCTLSTGGEEGMENAEKKGSVSSLQHAPTSSAPSPLLLPGDANKQPLLGRTNLHSSGRVSGWTGFLDVAVGRKKAPDAYYIPPSI